MGCGTSKERAVVERGTEDKGQKKSRHKTVNKDVGKISGPDARATKPCSSADSSLEKHIQECQQQKLKLKKVGDPDAARKKKLKQIITEEPQETARPRQPKKTNAKKSSKRKKR